MAKWILTLAEKHSWTSLPQLWATQVVWNIHNRYSRLATTFNPELKGDYFDTIEVIADFVKNLEFFIKPAGSVIPIVRKTNKDGTYTFSDPTGKFRDFYTGSTQANDSPAEEFFNKWEKVVLREDKEISFFIVWSNEIEQTDSSLSLAHLESQRKYFVARHNEIENAYVDDMTGLASKNVFTRLEERADYDMCYLDLSWFKLFNDRFGHALWDDALRYFGEVISLCAHKRPGDFIIHKWGDEFLILLKHTDQSSEAMQKFSAKIIEYLKNHPFEFEYTDKEGVKHQEKVHLETHINLHEANGSETLKKSLWKLSTTAKSESAEMASFMRIINGTKLLSEFLEYLRRIHVKIAKIPEGREHILKNITELLQRKITLFMSLRDDNSEEAWKLLWEEVLGDIQEKDYDTIAWTILIWEGNLRVLRYDKESLIGRMKAAVAILEKAKAPITETLSEK
jgi:diguanylate cyclase (GGDEF)-like protein